MSERTFDVVAIGEAMVEFNQHRRHQPVRAAHDLPDPHAQLQEQAQELEHAAPSPSTTYLAGFGGDTSKCVIAAARMGATTAYITRLGDNVFGDDLIAMWQREGVDATGVVRAPGEPTALYFVHHDNAGHRFSYRRAGSAASCIRPADLPAGLLLFFPSIDEVERSPASFSPKTSLPGATRRVREWWRSKSARAAAWCRRATASITSPRMQPRRSMRPALAIAMPARCWRGWPPGIHCPLQHGPPMWRQR